MKNSFIANGGEYHFSRSRPRTKKPPQFRFSEPIPIPLPETVRPLEQKPVVEVIDIIDVPVLQSPPIEQSIIPDSLPVVQEEKRDVSAEIIQDKPAKRGRRRKVGQ